MLLVLVLRLRLVVQLLVEVGSSVVVRVPAHRALVVLVVAVLGRRRGHALPQTALLLRMVTSRMKHSAD